MRASNVERTLESHLILKRFIKTRLIFIAQVSTFQPKYMMVGGLRCQLIAHCFNLADDFK